VVFIEEPVGDPLRGVPLLAGCIEVVPQPDVDHRVVGINCEPRFGGDFRSFGHADSSAATTVR
jgi:hypothetical protein